MSNEERAREMAEEYRTTLYKNTDNCFDENDLDCAYEDMRTNTLNMAEWKDQQFREYLEEKKKVIMDNPYTGHCRSDMNLLDEIINDL